MLAGKALRFYSAETQVAYFNTVVERAQTTRAEAVKLCKKLCFLEDVKEKLVADETVTEAMTTENKKVREWLESLVSDRNALYMEADYKVRSVSSGTQKTPDPAVLPAKVLEAIPGLVVQLTKRSKKQPEEAPVVDRNTVLPYDLESWMKIAPYNSEAFMFDVGFADPPWSSRAEDRDHTWGLNMVSKMADYVKKHMKPGGNFFYFLPEAQIDQIRSRFMDSGLHAYPVSMVWIKRGTVAKGTIKSAQPQFREYILHVVHESGKNDWFEHEMEDAQLLCPYQVCVVSHLLFWSHFVFRCGARGSWFARLLAVVRRC